MTTVNDLPVHLAARIFVEGGSMPPWRGQKGVWAYVGGSAHMRADFHLTRTMGDMGDALASAIRKGDAGAVRELLSRAPQGEERLRLACSSKRIGCLPIHEAAKRNDAATVLAILESLPDATARAHAMGTTRRIDTALHVAAEAGSTDVVRVILDALTPEEVAGNMTHYGVGIFTPLHFAAIRGNEQASREMLSRLASSEDKRRALIARDSVNGWRPLDYAATRGGELCVLMQACGAEEVLDADTRGDTLLHFAAMGGSATAVHALMEALPSPRARAAALLATDSLGNTPLSLAIITGHRAVVLAMLSALRDAGLETEAIMRSCPRSDMTLMHLVAGCGHTEIALVLLSSLPDDATRTRALRARGMHGATPAMVAQRFGHEGLARWMAALQRPWLPVGIQRFACGLLLGTLLGVALVVVLLCLWLQPGA